MNKTVLDLDLVGYSSIARILQESGSASNVADLNKQIQSFVDRGLTCVGAQRADVVAATTGDGAILVLDAPDEAHCFARTLHEAAVEHNASRTEQSAKRQFRTGAATGEIDFQRRPDGALEIAGIAIANAVRMEAAAGPGELLVEATTFDGLSDALKVHYEPEERVPGKRDEVFRARRCRMVQGAAPPPAPPKSPSKSHPARSERRAILELFDKLYPEDRLAELIFLLRMKVGHQPSQYLPFAERKAAVLKWADSPAGPGLAELESELWYLIEKES